METKSGGPTGAPRFTPLPIEEVARLFPQLEILGLLGAGGMGAVYKARQPALDRMVALKILPPTGTGGVNFADRFNREARALARLSHPNIVAVHEFGQTDGFHYLIMEYVDGANLRQLEMAGRLSPREALQIIPQICDALQYAHDEGVVHRDIKPENVLVDRKGKVKIADFGLAKILGVDTESLRLTTEGQVMGTPHYMAPEQVERPLAVDHRADIYSLGVVFYEMLTGDLPLGNFPPPSRKVRMDVRLDEVVLRALENDPERRYQKASEVKSRVETIAGGPPLPDATPEPAPAEPRAVRWAGFPLAIERNGVRGVNWLSALHALAIVFGVLTVGFGMVSLITGRSLFGGLGLVGWQGVAVRLLLAIAVVGWGVRCALRGPTPAGETGGVPGASGRPEGRWWWNTKKGGIVLAGLCVLLIGLTAGLRERPSSFIKPPAQRAVKDPVTGAWIARLPTRGSLELLAVADPAAGPEDWWRPDGHPAAPTTFRIEDPGDIAAATKVRKDLIFRFVDLPAGADQPVIESDPASPYVSSGAIYCNDHPLEHGWAARMAWPASVSRATLRLGIGLEPWRTVFTHQRATRRSTHQRQAGDPRWKFEIHHITANAGGTQLMVVKNLDDTKWQTRLVAVDNDGMEHGETSAQSTTAERTATWVYNYAIPLESIREFRAQVRPLHWVEFPRVVLRARGPTHPSNHPVAAPMPAIPVTPELLAQRPQVRFVAWQHDWLQQESAAARHPDGTAIVEPQEMDLLRFARPTRCDVGDARSGQANPSFLHLWFAHPLFDLQSLVSITLMDEDGRSLPLGARGTMAHNAQRADALSGNTGWLVATLSPGDADIPSPVGVRLEYALGPLERSHIVAPDFRGGMGLEGNSQLSAIGSDAEGKSFVALSVNKQDLGARQFGVVAVDLDGREVAQSGGGHSGSVGGALATENFVFDLPLIRVKHFKIGTRAVRTAEWKEVVLPPLSSTP